MPEYIPYTNGNSDEILPHRTDIEEQSYRPEVPKVTSRKTTERKAISKGSVYKVKQGDTVSKIAQRYGISIEELKRLNNLKNINRIYIGDELNLGKTVTSNKANRTSFNNEQGKGGRKLNEITISYNPKTGKGVNSTKGLPDYHW